MKAYVAWMDKYYPAGDKFDALHVAAYVEGIYVLSLGSQKANRHLHFHVAALPPGLPLERQQFHALMAENGVLKFGEAEMAAMASSIGAAYLAAER